MRFKFRVWNNSEIHYNDFVVTATGYVAKLNAIYNVEYDNEKDEEKEIQSEHEFMIDNSDLDFEKDKILMQCTGLKDKNGKLINEGDIVKIFHVSGTMQGKYFFDVVEWNDLRCRFDTENYGIINDDDVYEVIGNIYENPELLKEKDQ